MTASGRTNGPIEKSTQFPDKKTFRQASKKLSLDR